MERRQYHRPSFWKTHLDIGAALLAIPASAYLYLTHKDHVLAALPFLLLAACPLSACLHALGGMARIRTARSPGSEVRQIAGSGRGW